MRLGNCDVRVEPDAASAADPEKSNVILEVKCPHSDAMRGVEQLEGRMYLHAKQCLLGFLVFPRVR